MIPKYDDIKAMHPWLPAPERISGIRNLQSFGEDSVITLALDLPGYKEKSLRYRYDSLIEELRILLLNGADDYQKFLTDLYERYADDTPDH